jgi:membrane protease YdiL (CAAX protease family)
LLKEKPLYQVTILVAIVSTLLFRLFIYIIGRILSNLQIESLAFDIGLRLFVFSIIELIGVLVFFFYFNKKSLIPKSANFLYYISAVVLAIIYVLAQEWLNIVYDSLFGTNYEELINYNFKIPVFTKLLVAQVFIIPIAEELFFRKFIQKGLEEYYNGYIALTLSCLLFTVAHYSDFHNMFLVFFGGLISAILYFKSKSYAPSLVFHIIWNLTIASS